MNQDFFTNLPSDITINILSRLPVPTIISCKRVCKAWLDLLETREFANSHLSNSVPGLALYHTETDSDLLKIFGFQEAVEELDHHELRYNQVTNIDLSAFISPTHSSIGIEGSVNGLLLLREINAQPNVLYVCNPITRDYVKLPSPDGIVHHYPAVLTYGFGVSKISAEYKVVRIFHECDRDPETHSLLGTPESECHIYTLGTGSWRSIAPAGVTLEYNCRSVGALLKGNLHWLVSDLKGLLLISCLDLETERFSMLSAPPNLPESRRFLGGLVVLEDCLCLCDNTSDDEIVIWLMKEYGVEKSWRKEYVIGKVQALDGPSYQVIYPIKVFRDGDILMAYDDFYLLYYSDQSKTTARVELFEQETCDRIEATLHTSSFVSLKSFAVENVGSFQFPAFLNAKMLNHHQTEKKRMSRCLNCVIM